MLSELRVRELGVIADVDLQLGPGLTVITGETGAGKTLIVEALELLVGGRSDATLVRHGAAEALVEGRFVRDSGEETIVSRALPANGRTRVLIDDRMAPLAGLEELGRELVDLYGQHTHQSLLRAGAQRRALDEFGRIDLSDVRALRAEIAELDRVLDSLGGDDHQRAREIDLLRFELEEIERARISSELEEETLAQLETELSLAGAMREALEGAHEDLEGGRGPGAGDLIATALERLGRLEPVAELSGRLSELAVMVSELASDLRRRAEGIEEDPSRLAEVVERRQLLRRLVRKHGESLADVLAAGAAASDRLALLEDSEARRAAIETERAAKLDALREAEAVVGTARRAAARRLAPAVESHLGALALGSARLEVHVGGGDFGDDVEFLLAANRGEPLLPLSRVASGGELARVMLALRLVLSSAPETLVFDEVDAGIGGEAALAVARSLATLGQDHQVLVVTHLAQVAAFADCQLVVEKDELDGRTVSRCRAVEGEERVVELSRMLSGQPDSHAARQHAAELLAEGAGRAAPARKDIRHQAARAL